MTPSPLISQGGLGFLGLVHVKVKLVLNYRWNEGSCSEGALMEKNGVRVQSESRQREVESAQVLLKCVKNSVSMKRQMTFQSRSFTTG